MKKIKKLLVKFIIWLSASFYKRAKYPVKNEAAKVNLGCGLQCLPDWLNIDGSLTSLFGSKKYNFINKLLYQLAGSSNYYTFEAFNKVIQVDGLKFFNLQHGVPLTDSSAKVIYCSHFLEHLSKLDGRNFLKECYRSLKTNGIMRITIPDLDLAYAMYSRGEVEKMQDLFYFNSTEWDFGAHKYNYNFTYLQEVLEVVGFKEIKKLSYRTGNCPDIDYLDVYPEHSLYVECIKL